MRLLPLSEDEAPVSLTELSGCLQSFALLDQLLSREVKNETLIMEIASEMTSEEDRQKILLIGIDSGTWNVITPLLETGDLPHISRLIEEGASGVLHSFEYSASPVVWTTMTTGKVPSKHGIRDFFTPQQHLKAHRIWEILADHGETVGIYQHLVTWPPKSLNGFVIPAWLAIDSQTHPPELSFIKSLKAAEKRGQNSLHSYLIYGIRALHYGLGLSTGLKALSYLAVRKRSRIRLDYLYHAQQVDISMSTDFFCNLMDRYHPKFASIVYYQPDAAGHVYWKHFQPDLFPRVTRKEIAQYTHAIPKVYRAIDSAIRRILATTGNEYTVFVVSDHGMGPALHPSSYLYRPRIAKLLENLGFTTDGEHAIIGLDFYLNLHDQPSPIRSPDHLLTFLNQIVIQGTDEQLFEATLLEDQYVVVRVKAAHPDYTHTPVQLPNGETLDYLSLVNTDEDLSGTHEKEGIIIMNGPNIRRNHKFESATLLDVTPTILALMGMPVAEDMDGNVLIDAITEDYLVRHPIQKVASYDADLRLDMEEPENKLKPEEIQILETRLRDIGYLD